MISLGKMTQIFSFSSLPCFHTLPPPALWRSRTYMDLLSSGRRSWEAPSWRSGDTGVSSLSHPVQQAATQPRGLCLTSLPTLSDTVVSPGPVRFRNGAQIPSPNHPPESAELSARSRRLLSSERPQPGLAEGAGDPMHSAERAQHGASAELRVRPIRPLRFAF